MDKIKRGFRPGRAGIIAAVISLAVVFVVLFIKYGAFSPMRRKYNYLKANTIEGLDKSIAYFEAKQLKNKKNSAEWNLPLARVLTKQAVLYVAKSNYKAGRENLEKAVKLDPKNDMAFKYLGIVFSQMLKAAAQTEQKQMYLKEALRYYHVSLSLNAGQPDVKYALGVLNFFYNTEAADHQRLGINYMHEAIQSDEKYIQPYLALGRFYYERRDYQNSMKYYRAVQPLLKGSKQNEWLHSKVEKNMNQIRMKLQGSSY